MIYSLYFCNPADMHPMVPPKNGKFHLEQARPVVYSHGDYLATGEKLGTFGHSVRKKGD